MASRRSNPGAARRLLLSGLFLLAFLSVESAFGREAEITDLRTDLSGNQYVVSFQVDGAFPEEVEERIASGLETNFRHRIRVYRKRTGWFDKVLQERVTTTTVNYDSLTRQYTLSRRLDGQLQETTFTEEPQEMRRWMSELHGIPLGEISDFSGEGRYFVRVKSNIRSRFFLFFIPVRWDTKWQMTPILEPGVDRE